MCPFEFVTINEPTKSDFARTGPRWGAALAERNCSTDQRCRIFEEWTLGLKHSEASEISERPPRIRRLAVFASAACHLTFWVSRCAKRLSSHDPIELRFGPLLAMRVGRALLPTARSKERTNT